MSNPTNDPNVKPIIVTQNEDQAQESGEKLTFVTKTKQFVKNHKKPAIAVGALVGLVGLAAVTGRRQEPLPGVQATLELEPPHMSFDTEVVESETDTESA